MTSKQSNFSNIIKKDIIQFLEVSQVGRSAIKCLQNANLHQFFAL